MAISTPILRIMQTPENRTLVQRCTIAAIVKPGTDIENAISWLFIHRAVVDILYRNFPTGGNAYGIPLNWHPGYSGTKEAPWIWPTCRITAQIPHTLSGT